MIVTIRRAGRCGLLVELLDPAAVLDLARRITAALGAGGYSVVRIQPAARTVLIALADPAETAGATHLITELAAGSAGAGTPGDEDTEVVIPVRYDGPDLDELAGLTGLTRADIVRAHTSVPWRAAFTGFVPGFCYLTGGDPRLIVPRRKQSRPRVPPGSVAVAGGYAGVYPAASPGGWHLLGTTDVKLWDVTAPEPALIRPGMLVRFVDTGTAAAHSAVVETHGAGRRAHLDDEKVTRALVVVDPGPLSLLQDSGRPGFASSGVGRSGAADRASFHFANALVGNVATAAVIECTFGGLTVQARGDHTVAVTGAPAPLTVDGEPVGHGATVELRDGATLALRTPKAGLRSYLAVRGGIEVTPVLGSASTDLISGLGPDPLRRNDVLRIGNALTPSSTAPAAPPIPLSGTLELSVTAGPRDDWFDNPADLATGEWMVSPQSNRVGLRLDRRPGGPDPALQRRDHAELPSEGVVIGSIQVPPSGQPVLFLADHPVTGGYPVIAVVDQADVDRAAQARPGQRIRFRFADRTNGPGTGGPASS